MTDAKKKSRARDVFEKIGLVLASIVFFLLAAELGARALSDEVDTFAFKNFALSKLLLFQSAFPASYDPELGWIPTPGYSSSRNQWNKKVTIDDDGLRVTNPGEFPGPPIITLGDSFMFGDEVDDEDSMPARLEARLNQRVLNAGVFGYGIDQAVLRGERMLEKHDPAWVILMIVPEDVWRQMLRIRTGVEKPLFDLVDGKLVLTNVPVSPTRPSIDDVGLGRKVFGYSYLVDWTYRRLNRAKEWYIGDFPEHYAYNDGEKAQKIGCMLIRRLGEKLKARGIRGIITSAYSRPATQAPTTNEYLDPTHRMLDCGASAGMLKFDTHPTFHRIASSDPKKSATLFVDGRGHFSRAGNDLVAEKMQALITGTSTLTF
ncbi:MAG: hypothetical protein RIT81_43790 [Deltaproteobacteria bacterium]